MRATYYLVTAVALVSSSLLFGNQICLLVQGSATEGAQTQNQNTNQQKPPVGGGGPSHGGGSGPRRRAAMITKDAAKVIDEIMSVPDKAIPVELLGKAEAIAIFPGAHEGVISRQIDNVWGPPVFFYLRDGDFGVQRTDYVLLIMNEDSLNSLLKDEFEIGNEGKTAAGPIGRVAAGSTDARIDAGILSYSRSKSLFSGAVLRRTVISPDDGLNEAIYQLKASKLLTSFSGHGKLPADLRLLPQTLARYSRR